MQILYAKGGLEAEKGKSKWFNLKIHLLDFFSKSNKSFFFCDIYTDML